MKNSEQLEKEFIELARETHHVTDINAFVLGCFMAKYDSLLYDYIQLKKEYESKTQVH
jgi:hypothetical protein